MQTDTRRLPPRYAGAGVGELWLIDARGEAPRFDLKVLDDGSYRNMEPDAEGWSESPLLAGRVRLSRQATQHSGWLYELEVEQA